MKTIKVEKQVPELSYDLAEGIVKNLQRQVLNVAEATMEGSKLEASKRLIKGHFNESLTRLFEMFMYHGKVEEERIPNYDDETI